MTDPKFRSFNRLFVVSSIKDKDDFRTVSFDRYYQSLVEIKTFNKLTDNESFFDLFIKDKQEAYEKPVEMTRNND